MKTWQDMTTAERYEEEAKRWRELVGNLLWRIAIDDVDHLAMHDEVWALGDALDGFDAERMRRIGDEMEKRGKRVPGDQTKRSP